MQRRTLQGTLEEQCEFLYQLALEKIEQGNFTGAKHALDEIIKYAPDYRDAAALLVEVKKRKNAQRNRLFFALGGAVLFIGVGTITGIRNDLVFLILALLGAVLGYGIGNFLDSLRHSSREGTIE